MTGRLIKMELDGNISDQNYLSYLVKRPYYKKINDLFYGNRFMGLCSFKIFD